MDNLTYEKSPLVIDYEHLESMEEYELWRHFQVFNTWRNTIFSVKVVDATKQQIEYMRYGLKVKAKLKAMLREKDVIIKL